MMKTFAEKYKESIISLSKDDMIRERETIISSIDQKRERLQAVSNDKKMHDIRVSIKKDKIRLREIDYLLRQAHTENSIYHLLDQLHCARLVEVYSSLRNGRRSLRQC